MSWLFTLGTQSIRASTSASVLPMNIQDCFPSGQTGLILQSKGLKGVFSSTTVQKDQFFGAQPSLWSNSHTWSNLLYGPILTPSHTHMTTGKIIALTVQILFGEVLFLLFHMLSKFVLAFPPRSKCLLISWLQTPSAVILEHKKIKSVTVSNFSSSICHEVILVFFSIFQIPYSSLYKLKHYFCLVVIL